MRARALLVGLKRVDPNAYGGWTGESGCWGCELDVDNIDNILRPLGYEIETLKTEAATAARTYSRPMRIPSSGRVFQQTQPLAPATRKRNAEKLPLFSWNI